VNERVVRISVIIPAYQAEKVIPFCLHAIRNSSYPPHEIIVVDDHSTDRTAIVGLKYSAVVLRAENHGPAAARNIGARNASGDVLLFIDSDVVIRPDTVARVSRHFQGESRVAAVFGSYDSEPAEQNFVSQYKNLQHHYVHQASNAEATTFWAGCGAVRRDVFWEVRGFDEARYSQPSIEDIELGQRLRTKGYRIALDKEMCVKHLKLWTFRSHVRTEIFNRAIPWSNLIFEHGKIVRDLNLTMSHRISAGLVWLLILCVPLLAIQGLFIVPLVVSLLLILLLNREFYRFFWKHRGLAFAMKSVPLHLLHYAYSAAAFTLCWTVHAVKHRRSRSTFSWS
jgi:glycosyltransferase involved in cell wall biosynthesis